MLEFLARYLYIFIIIIIMFVFLYIMGGDDIVFFRRKKYRMDPKSSENLLRALRRFASPRGYKVLGPTVINFGGNRYSFDVLLISLWGTVAFRAVPQTGEIYVENGRDLWLQIFQGQRNRFSNPLAGSDECVKMFRDLYRAEGVKYGKSDVVAVVTDPKTLVAAPKMMPVRAVNYLTGKLEKNYLSDNGADIDGMRAAIEKYSR